MFYYFGSKRRMAPLYPEPLHQLIIEPFAGSAGYACHHAAGHDVLLVERDPRVVALWDRVRSMSVEEALSLPAPELGSRTTDMLALTRAVSEHSLASRYITVQPRLVSRWPQLRARLAEMIPLVQGWTIVEGDYTRAPDVEATWFIDPPYQKKVRGYAFRPDFDLLAEWVLTRRGQVIVCEQQGADWLPFVPLAEIVGVNGKRSTEVIWTNS